MAIASDPPLVSVLLPVLDEEQDIQGCIDALGAQSYPHTLTEIVVVDGASVDRTVEVVRSALNRSDFRRVTIVSNPKRRTSTSLNVGLDHADGDVIIRVDARSRISPEYIQRVVEILSDDPTRGVVGGAQVAIPRSGRLVDVGMARALRNRWSTGLSRYRRSARSGPADTVWMGAFNAAELRRLGGWSDAVALNEDFELNERYRRAGKTVWFEASLESGYLPRRDLRGLARQYFYFGRVKGTWWARGGRPAPRQWLLLGLPPAAAGAAGLATRRVGGKAVLPSLAVVAVVVERTGARGPATGALGSAIAIVSMSVMAGSWWIGVLAGIAGEWFGVEHAHG